jgi:hypothetical protein
MAQCIAAECPVPSDNDEVRTLFRLGESLWKETEGEALRQLKAIHQRLCAAIESGWPCSGCESGGGSVGEDARGTGPALRLLAALGPAFWMLGAPQDGLELAARVEGQVTLDDEWEDIMFNTGETTEGAAEETTGPQTCHAWVNADSMADDSVAPVGPRRWLAGLPHSLLLACALDGAGTNAYALTRYDHAGQLHAKALKLADAYLAGGSKGGIGGGEGEGEGEGEGASDGEGDGDSHGKSDEGVDQAFALDALVVRSRALDGLGRVARESGRYAASVRLHDRAAAAALAMVRASNSMVSSGGAGDRDGKQRQPQSLRPSPATLAANAASNAGVAANRLADAALSTRYHSEALRLRTPLGDQRGTSSSVGNLALLAAQAGDVETALRMYRDSMALRCLLRDDWGVAGSQRAIGHLLVQRCCGLLPRRQPGAAGGPAGAVASALLGPSQGPARGLFGPDAAAAGAVGGAAGGASGAGGGAEEEEGGGGGRRMRGRPSGSSGPRSSASARRGTCSASRSGECCESLALVLLPAAMHAAAAAVSEVVAAEEAAVFRWRQQHGHAIPDGIPLAAPARVPPYQAVMAQAMSGGSGTSPLQQRRAACLFGAAVGLRRRTGAATGVVMEHAAARALWSWGVYSEALWAGAGGARASCEEGERLGAGGGGGGRGLDGVMAMAADAVAEMAEGGETGAGRGAGAGAAR